MGLSHERFLRLNEERWKLLIQFASTAMTVEEYLDKDKSLFSELLLHTTKITEKELCDSLEHEREHKKIWDKHGIKAEYRRAWELNLTMDVDFDEKAKTMEKEYILGILKEVCIAPYSKGHSLEHCMSDLIQYEVLNGTLSFTSMEEARRHVRMKYGKKAN